LEKGKYSQYELITTWGGEKLGSLPSPIKGVYLSKKGESRVKFHGGKTGSSYLDPEGKTLS